MISYLNQNRTRLFRATSILIVYDSDDVDNFDIRWIDFNHNKVNTC